MKFKESTVTTQLEILNRRIGGELFVPVTLDESAFTSSVCKAGNPIGADGAIDNGESSAAVGILLNDVYDSNPNGTIVKAFATVNVENCEANAGITLNDSVKAALPLIVFE